MNDKTDDTDTDNVFSFDFDTTGTDDNAGRSDDDIVSDANEKIAAWKAAGTQSLREVHELFHTSICANAGAVARDKIIAAIVAAFGNELGSKQALRSDWTRIAKDIAKDYNASAGRIPKPGTDVSRTSTLIVAVPNWRERDRYGPIPSMHNARLAIIALGIVCSYDTFHNKMLFGYRDNAAPPHVLSAMLGEVTDSGIIRLRQVMSDHFGFDMKDVATRDAVISLALDHCFDPVRDMLEQAQGEWDGVKRLDRMVVEYFNCADTPLNRAIVRKVMIAAVRRVRHPGCKFDNITVMESEEGWEKSMAWRVLAGDENFSDVPILGHGVKEVQEQLSEVWIHESADLAGMKKADVEGVKVFASRQSDNARPAYGHFLKKQKRHSIEVGTTNNDEYLQSQTGNRRFWPLKLLAPINIEMLKRDRLQLWGEAAKYEAEGESIVLDANLWPAAKEEQEKRRVKDPWEDILNNIPTHVAYTPNNEFIYLKKGNKTRRATQIRHLSKDRSYEMVASADLLKHVLTVPVQQQTNVHGMKLAAAMKRNGWEHDRVFINGIQVRGYRRPVTAAQAEDYDWEIVEPKTRIMKINKEPEAPHHRSKVSLYDDQGTPKH